MQAFPSSLQLNKTGRHLSNVCLLLASFCTTHGCLSRCGGAGDADGMVPLTDTRRWVFELGTEEHKKKKTHWHHWTDPRGQVRGECSWKVLAVPRLKSGLCRRSSPHTLRSLSRCLRQVGGYLDEYADFTFLTLRRAGHEAPYTAQERAFSVYSKWLVGEDIV